MHVQMPKVGQASGYVGQASGYLGKQITKIFTSNPFWKLQTRHRVAQVAHSGPTLTLAGV